MQHVLELLCPSLLMTFLVPKFIICANQYFSWDICFYFVADFLHGLKAANGALIENWCLYPFNTRYRFSSQQVGFRVGIHISGVPGSPHSQENKIRLLRLWKGKANQPTNMWRGVIWRILDKLSFFELEQENYFYFHSLYIPNILLHLLGLCFLLTHLHLRLFLCL